MNHSMGLMQLEKLDSVLLVDDSYATNFYNKKVLEKSGKVQSIQIANDGLEALNFIKENAENKNLLPDIIFLDINMPKMNGFEFLEAYEKLNIDNLQKTIIIFLTTSEWSHDKIKAKENNLVFDIIQKPLSKTYFEKLYSKCKEAFFES